MRDNKWKERDVGGVLDEGVRTRLMKEVEVHET
jgi:hypothetical protein